MSTTQCETDSCDAVIDDDMIYCYKCWPKEHRNNLLRGDHPIRANKPSQLDRIEAKLDSLIQSQLSMVLRPRE